MHRNGTFAHRHHPGPERVPSKEGSFLTTTLPDSSPLPFGAALCHEISERLATRLQFGKSSGSNADDQVEPSRTGPGVVADSRQDVLVNPKALAYQPLDPPANNGVSDRCPDGQSKSVVRQPVGPAEHRQYADRLSQLGVVHGAKLPRLRQAVRSAEGQPGPRGADVGGEGRRVGGLGRDGHGES